jgi:hypothetical protein
LATEKTKNARGERVKTAHGGFGNADAERISIRWGAPDENDFTSLWVVDTSKNRSVLQVEKAIQSNM